MITRRRDYSKKAPSKDARKVYIICEGKGSEPDYFRFFEGLSSNLQLIVIPPEDGTDPMKLKMQSERLFFGDFRRYTIDYLQRDMVWFVIDTDTWEKEGKIALLRDFCNSNNARFSKEYDEAKPYQAWNVAQSNPCFEIWLYYHIYKDRPDMDDACRYRTFKEFVSAVIAGGFDYQRDPARIDDAVSNASSNFERQGNGSPALYSTEVYRLGEEICRFVKRQIDILRGKMA